MKLYWENQLASTGYLGDATAFQNNDIRDFTKVLSKYGYEKNGNEVMYSGLSGEQIKTEIFMGPTYYQRLKIMVADKMHSRSTGHLQRLKKSCETTSIGKSK